MYNDGNIIYHFKATWNFLGQDGIGHFFHLVTSYTLQNKILILSLQAHVKSALDFPTYIAKIIIIMLKNCNYFDGQQVAVLKVIEISTSTLCDDLSYAKYVKTFPTELLGR